MLNKRLKNFSPYKNEISTNMKTIKVLLLIMFLSITSISFGQIKGIDFSTAASGGMKSKGTLNKSNDGNCLSLGLLNAWFVVGRNKGKVHILDILT